MHPHHTFLHVVIAIAVFFGVFIGIAVIVKLREVRAASRWPSVPGKVISASASAKEVTTHHATEDGEEGKTEKRNFARISYRYKVGAKEYTCSRLSIGEDMGNDDVEGKLKRYPVGKAVEVFYNPVDPGKAVLERTLPNGCLKGALIAIGLVIGAVAFFGYGLDHATALLAPHMKHPDKASMVVFAGTFSLLCAWFTVALWNQGRTARSWSRTTGWIEPVEKPIAQPIIVYNYQVNGVSYKSDVVDFGGNKRTVFKLASGVTIRGGEPGQGVEVLYDPANPAKACLYAGTRLGWLPLVISVIVGGLAWMIFTG